MQCSLCGAGAQLRCSKCHAVYYCTRGHQKQNWLQHKTTCCQVIAKKKTLVILEAMEEKCLKTLVAMEQNLSAVEKFALHRYYHIRVMTNANADAARISEGEAMLKLLEKEKVLQNSLFRCFLVLIASAYDAQGCEASAYKILNGAFPGLNGYLQAAKEDNKAETEFCKIKTRAFGSTRLHATLVEGQEYFEAKQAHNGVKIVLDSTKGGYDVVCNHTCNEGSVIFEEDALLACSLDHTRCHHCTKRYSDATLFKCRGNCGLIYCCSLCESKAWNFYHKFLCDVECIVRFKAMCDYILMAAKSSVGKFPLLQFKILGAALKTEQHICSVAPFCYLHRGSYTWSLSAFPKQLKYLYGVLTSPHLARHKVFFCMVWLCLHFFFRFVKTLISLG